LTFGSPIFRKLFLSALALIALTLAIADFLLTRYAARQQTEAVEYHMATLAAVLQGELQGIPVSELEQWARISDSRAAARVTLIAPDGKVLADSQQAPETMENHAGRPEVKDALSGRNGVSVRHSATIKTDLFYVAVPVSYGGQSGYALRLAAPLRSLEQAVAEVRRRILSISAISALLALAMAYWAARSFSVRVRRLQRFADNLAHARFSEKLVRDGEDELGALAASLSETATRLSEFVDRLSVESARREAILTSMIEGVLAVDSQMRVIFCNPAFARAVGRELPITERLPVLELVRDPAFLDMLSRTLVTGESTVERLRLADAGGRVYEVHTAPLAPPKRLAAIAVCHDVTELVRLERVRKDFVANVSHELRTPLAAVIGYAETLLDGALEDPENNRKFVEIIRAQSVRLNNIAADLLTLSSLESEQPDLPAEPVAVRSALEAAIRTVEPEARTRRVEMTLGRTDDAFVMGHRIRLEQVFINLLDNAVKFNRPGGSVRAEAAVDGGIVRIVVSDTGIGIPFEDQSRIFERFYRVDKARSRQAGGTGLGLSIVKHAVERMGGSVAIESELGKGTRVTLEIPLAQEAV
jgi:two-component system phosphate regulon sensor histidine kinase PhoR